MIKNYLLFIGLSVLFCVSDSYATEEMPLTVVVGNSRVKGGVKPCVAELVEQDKADFTHLKSFENSKVVSVDIAPLRLNLNCSHLSLDFINTSPQCILSKLNETQPARILFEWFPSCAMKGYKEAVITPLLLPAIKNAFEILASGGEQIIDHMPYVLSLPDNSARALEKLEEIGASKTLINQVQSTLKLHNLYDKPGIVSRLLQKADPFTLHISRGEYSNIRDYLMSRCKNVTFDESKHPFIKGNLGHINQIISNFASALHMDEVELMIRISNGILYSFNNTKEEEQGYADLFDQHYYMKTRGAMLLEKLRSIGFTVGDDAIRYFEVNPYNKRKHAWLIFAKKIAKK